MNIRAFALALGVAFGLVGIAGFVPGMTHSIHTDAPPLAVSQGYGLVLGLFPVNILHNLVHLLFGVLGLAAYAGTFSAVQLRPDRGGVVWPAHRHGADPRAQHDLRPGPDLRGRRRTARASSPR